MGSITPVSTTIHLDSYRYHAYAYGKTNTVIKTTHIQMLLLTYVIVFEMSLMPKKA